MSILGISFAFHLIGINLWVGASFLLPLAIIPALRRMTEDMQTAFLKTFVARYLPLFVLGGITVGITGWFQTFDMLDDLNMTAAYIKHGAIVLLILVSAVEWLYLARRLAGAPDNRPKVWQWFVSMAWLQAALGVIILFLTGWLTE